MNLSAKLDTMTREQLAAFANTQGIPVHHKAKPETIKKAIMDKVSTPPQPQAANAEPKAPVTPVYHTPEQVKAAIATVLQRQPKMEVIFSTEDPTVTLRCLGAEECFNLTVPLKMITQRAGIIARGRVAPLGHSPSDFQPGQAPNPHSAYTNTVLQA